MKTNSIAAAYPINSRVNSFTKISWMKKYDESYAEFTERKVFCYHEYTHRAPYAVKVRKGSSEWDTAFLSKAKYLPLGLI